MKTIWGLCLLCLAGGLRAAHAGPIRRTSNPEERAPQKDVNVLMFGVIQFSESLHYVYETMDAKLARISQTLKSHEETLQTLGSQTEQAAEVGQQMKEVIQLLQDQMAEQQGQTKRTRDWLSNMEPEVEELKTRVKHLEMYLINSVPSAVKELQERAEGHSEVLGGLQELIQLHKESINTQNDQLSKLHGMSETVI